MRRPKENLARWLAMGVAAVAVSGLALVSQPARAQDTGWSTPRLIFEGLGRLDWPQVIADKYGQVHALWLYGAEETGASGRLQLYYTRLDVPNAQPIDVEVFNGSLTSMNAEMMGAAIFATWNGRGYAQSAPAPGMTARDWFAPRELVDTYFHPGLAEGADGSMWMAYGAPSDNGIYVKRLDPETGAWDNPQPVSYTFTPNTAPDWTRIVVDREGRLHVTWVEYQLPEGAPAMGIYYSQSLDGGNTWSNPRQMAPGGYNQANVIIGPEQTIYVTYLGIAGVGGRYLVESNDSGRTWNETEELAPAGGAGTTGGVEIAIDSRNVVHVLFNDRGCIWHHERLETGWSEGECVSTPAFERALKEYPSMAVGLGNQLHVMFWTERKQLWYTTRTLDAPAIAAVPLPTLPPPTPTVPVVTATLEPTATYLPDMGPPPELGAATRVSMLSVVAGVAPVVLFFGVLLVARSLRRK
jgi:hypothetical protein